MFLSFIPGEDIPEKASRRRIPGRLPYAPCHHPGTVPGQRQKRIQKASFAIRRKTLLVREAGLEPACPE